MTEPIESGHRPDAAEPAALACADLRVWLDGNLIVDGVSLAAEQGRWLTIIGPNGAGKSTLLQTLAGVLPHDGRILVHGRELARLPRRERARGIAVVPQTPVIPPGMRVLDYVLLGRTPYIPMLGRESRRDVEVADSVLRRLDLVAFAGRRLETLSGGERQRAILARALAQLSGAGTAAVLLLDEPTTALDIGHQQEVLELIDSLRRDDGMTVVATMHDLAIAGEYADHMVLLLDGGVVASGTPAEVLTEEHLATHYRAHVRVLAGESGPVVVPVRVDRRE